MGNKDQGNQWIGRGVLFCDGKDYGYGDIIPDSIDPERINKFREQGLVGSVVKSVVDTSVKVKELTVALEGAIKKIASCDERICQLDAELANEKEKNAELSAENQKLNEASVGAPYPPLNEASAAGPQDKKNNKK